MNNSTAIIIFDINYVVRINHRNVSILRKFSLMYLATMRIIHILNNNPIPLTTRNKNKLLKFRFCKFYSVKLSNCST